ncbi:MAG: hypothetical protein A2X56_03550 [Nitrospirae bacterium GWC2_57_13]|jgi:hypothetical protein|nr:MAG: hypothetical protein A2X56_03550 [Nitrospirae bacterium GWC2_57_13]OGW40627.1 MAG: hypothetical protein A2X57_03435 [Nitrospirae bacterium GWD2_57_8]
MVARRIGFVFALILASLAASTGYAYESDAFDKGTKRVTALVGSGTAFDESYFIIGAGFGYYIADNLELGIDAESWSGGTYDITRVSPSVRYVLPARTEAKPYIGAFYQRTFISELPDRDAVGGRAGVFWLTGQRTYFGAGLVHTRTLNCDQSIYRPARTPIPRS